MKARTRASIRPLENHPFRIKMKSLSRLMLATAFAGILFACKKSSDNNSAAPMSNQDAATQSDDQTRVSNESDAAFDDVTTVMNDQTTCDRRRRVDCTLWRNDDGCGYGEKEADLRRGRNFRYH
ncbi:hypothetical protein ACQ86N_16390 [Puia sp. P3]|uniref:hypothetical protein n=1 Tax=Puia sp. P3 TaxID=3423952 RepID=UPI003D668B55